MTKIKKTPHTTPQKPVKPQPAKTKTAEKKPNSIMVGGIKYYSKDVKNVSTSKISEKDAGKGNTFHDATKYEVTLKDGTKITHTSHKQKDGSSTEKENLARKAEVQVENNGTVNFKGLYNADITDTPKNDNYRLLGCEYTTLEAARSETKTEDTGFVEKIKTKIFGHTIKSPEYKGKDKDNITVANRKLDNGKVQTSFSTFVEYNDGDVINEKECHVKTKDSSDMFGNLGETKFKN